MRYHLREVIRHSVDCKVIRVQEKSSKFCKNMKKIDTLAKIISLFKKSNGFMDYECLPVDPTSNDYKFPVFIQYSSYHGKYFVTQEQLLAKEGEVEFAGIMNEYRFELILFLTPTLSRFEIHANLGFRVVFSCLTPTLAAWPLRGHTALKSIL